MSLQSSLDALVALASRPGRQVASEAGVHKFHEPIGTNILPGAGSIGQDLSKGVKKKSSRLSSRSAVESVANELRVSGDTESADALSALKVDGLTDYEAALERLEAAMKDAQQAKATGSDPNGDRKLQAFQKAAQLIRAQRDGASGRIPQLASTAPQTTPVNSLMDKLNPQSTPISDAEDAANKLQDAQFSKFQVAADVNKATEVKTDSLNNLHQQVKNNVSALEKKHGAAKNSFDPKSYQAGAQVGMTFKNDQGKTVTKKLTFNDQGRWTVDNGPKYPAGNWSSEFISSREGAIFQNLHQQVVSDDSKKDTVPEDKSVDNSKAKINKLYDELDDIHSARPTDGKPSEYTSWSKKFQDKQVEIDAAQGITDPYHHDNDAEADLANWEHTESLTSEAKPGDVLYRKRQNGDLHLHGKLPNGQWKDPQGNLHSDDQLHELFNAPSVTHQGNIQDLKSTDAEKINILAQKNKIFGNAPKANDPKFKIGDKVKFAKNDVPGVVTQVHKPSINGGTNEPSYSWRDELPDRSLGGQQTHRESLLKYRNDK